MGNEGFGAIVLAGGKSTRMGQDKALLPLNGMTLLETVVVTLLLVTDNILVVADHADKYSLPCARVIGDTFPECGPVGGIITGLMAMGAGSHIVVACDMPALNTNVLQLLQKAATPEWDAVVPEINGRAEPLHAVYRHNSAPKLLRFLETGGFSVRDALETMKVKRIGEGVLKRIDPYLLSLTNVNTPEEVTMYLKGQAVFGMERG